MKEGKGRTGPVRPIAARSMETEPRHPFCARRREAKKERRNNPRYPTAGGTPAGPDRRASMQPRAPRPATARVRRPGRSPHGTAPRARTSSDISAASPNRARGDRASTSSRREIRTAKERRRRGRARSQAGLRRGRLHPGSHDAPMKDRNAKAGDRSQLRNRQRRSRAEDAGATIPAKRRSGADHDGEPMILRVIHA